MTFGATSPSFCSKPPLKAAFCLKNEKKLKKEREKFAGFDFLPYFCTAFKKQCCCCSSVVEHFLGKEEVTSSILVNSSREEERDLFLFLFDSGRRFWD